MRRTLCSSSASEMVSIGLFSRDASPRKLASCGTRKRKRKTENGNPCTNVQLFQSWDGQPSRLFVRELKGHTAQVRLSLSLFLSSFLRPPCPVCTFGGGFLPQPRVRRGRGVHDTCAIEYSTMAHAISICLSFSQCFQRAILYFFLSPIATPQRDTSAVGRLHLDFRLYKLFL